MGDGISDLLAPPEAGAPPMALASAPEGPEPDPDRLARWRGRIAESKRLRRDLLHEWRINVDYRYGKPFETASDDDRIAVNLDWSLTKSKQAQLFSQKPELVLHPKAENFQDAVPVYSALLNRTLEKARVAVALDQVLPDVINAAGIGAVLVAYEARTETVMVPAADPMLMAFLPPGQPMPMQPMTRITDARYTISRISPAQLLWPRSFTGSDFEDAPWIGRSGSLPWAEAASRFKLDPALKRSVTGQETLLQDRVSTDLDAVAGRSEEETVCFDELFYRRHFYHPDERGYCAIHHLVFVAGKDEPVIDQLWDGQQYDQEQGTGYVGSERFPIQVLTLTYVSDHAVPPSDTAIGRPQVDELNRSRSQMVQQRSYSLPIRWYDVNRVDPAVQDALMRGHWQQIFPIQGSGANAIGEVARATYPREDFTFDQVAKSDLQELWQTGAGALAAGERSASEVQIVQANAQTRIGYERSRVVNFFLRISDVVAGLLALHGDAAEQHLSEDERRRLAQWDRKRLNHQMVFNVRPDSTVLLDAEQRSQRVLRLMNVGAQSGLLNVEDLMRELVELTGLDPQKLIKRPAPSPPEPPNISYRFSGAEDLTNPLVVAMLTKVGQGPSPKELWGAQNLLAAIGIPAAPPAPPPPPPPGMAPEGPPGPGGGLPGLPLGMGPQTLGGPMEAGPGGPPAGPAGGPPVTPGHAYPDWRPSPRLMPGNPSDLP